MEPDARAAHRRRVVARYYGFTLSFSLLFWLPIFYEFQRRIGLSDERIFAIQALYYVVFCVLEIPTGFFADRVGHAVSMRAGAVVLVASHLVPSLSPTEPGMIAHYLLIALARSLVSGASSAWAYERLSELGEADAFKGIEGRARALGLVAKIVAWTFVGALLERWLTGPYWLTTGAALVSVAFALALPAPLGARRQRAPEPLAFRPALALLPKTPVLALVMLQGVALFVLQRLVQVNLFQPLLAAQAVPVSAYGVLLAATSVFEAAGSAWPERLQRWLSDVDAVFVLTLAMAASMVWLAFAGPASTIAALSVFSLVTGLSFPIQRQLLNDVIPDRRYRATLLSAESILDRAANAAAAAPLGLVLARGAVAPFLLGCAGATAALVALLFVPLRRLAPRR